ncbi:hypothetical protein AJ80_05460 [Polytolypa hystricis UAMH7299]|uniref:DUF7924 domain-containing protein n=1 Tax=Polytolypa hystricis (strain UAMH7299) TaxID=1447883 RepID=A0A2B7Y4J2_POLH7|nr:hypothetical protein AJ80_05460 [Polytolypa hystricis UAMH7299]
MAPGQGGLRMVRRRRRLPDSRSQPHGELVRVLYYLHLLTVVENQGCSINKARQNPPDKRLPSPSAVRPSDTSGTGNHKRKRPVEADIPFSFETEHLKNRQRKQIVGSVRDGIEKWINPVEYWIQNGDWPTEYFSTISGMDPLLTRKEFTYSKSKKHLIYFMKKADRGITEKSSALIRDLLSTNYTVHDESLFRDELFERTCEKLEGKPETRVIRDIGLLIVPSAEVLATYGSTALDCLIESNNEGWINSISFYGPRPQPDYAVGFQWSAFTNDQYEKLKRLTGNWDSTSYFLATYTMYFPFLTSEVKCSENGLEIADRQNAHSMTVAIRGIVELFRQVNREKEISREILGFSISHDNTSVRIYGHYCVIDGTDTTFWRHPIKKFDFTSEDGRERWQAYMFTRSVYEKFMPTHLARIRSAVDQLPYVSFDVSESELRFSRQSDAPSSSRNTETSFVSSADGTPNEAPNTSPARQSRSKKRRMSGRKRLKG